jgi:glucose-1-phosphate adenylyltransferase
MGSDSRITNFTEKPKDPEILKQFESGANPDKPFLASMGIYVFNTDVLQEVLEEKLVDFGRDILPQSIDKRRVCGYTFDGFWEDIGTIRRFFEVNLRMAKANAPFDFYAAHAPIFTHARFLPGSEVQNSRLDEVLLADGCRIYDSTVRESVVGLRSIIGSEANIQSSILMGADYYETDAEKAENRRLARPDIGIGENAVIKGAIVDKNARIGRDVTIRYIPDRPEEETESWVARDGIVIVPKNAIVRDNTVI